MRSLTPIDDSMMRYE